MPARRAWAWAREAPGLGGLLHRVARAALPAHVWVVVQGGPLAGMRFLCNPRFHLGYVRGDHEPWVAEWIESLLRPRGTFIDVGAHLGYFTLLAARRIRPPGRVIAFEPDPESFQLLAQNVRAAGLPVPVDVRQQAVGAFSGTVNFAAAHDVLSRVTRDAEGSMAVPQVKLDDLRLHGYACSTHRPLHPTYPEYRQRYVVAIRTR